MMDIKKLAGNWIFWALLVSVLGRLIVAYPLNSNLLGGSDFMGHVPIIWYMSEFLNLGWDEFWYGGYPIIKYVSPLPHLMGGFFALFTDSVIAYKIIINFFFLLTPLAFYIFIKNFNFSDTQKAVGILIFSFFPANIHYFYENSFPTLINILFSLLVWKSVINYSENRNMKNVCFASIFFCLSMLVHQLTAFFNIILVFLFCIVRYRKILLLPILLGSIIAGFWFFPFLLEYDSSGSLLKENIGFGNVLNAVVFDIGIVNLFAFVLLISVIILFLVVKSRDIDTLSFIFVFIAIIVILAFTSYMRIISVISIPIAFLLAKTSNKKYMMPIIFILLFVLIFSFYTLRDSAFMNEYERWEVPEAEDRVIYYPQGHGFCESYNCDKSIYSAYMPLTKKQSTISGVRGQYLTFGNMELYRLPYFNIIFNPLNYSDNEIYAKLNDGFVNTVVVNKNFPDYIKYFSNSAYFTKTNETEHFLVFAIKPQASYVEIDSTSVNADVKRELNKININLTCKKGIMTIKESYDNYWNAQITTNTTKELQIRTNKNGFMEADIDNEGKCEIQMKHETKKEYYVFYLISVFVLLLIILKRDYIPKVKSIFY